MKHAVDVHDVIAVFNALLKLPVIEDEVGIRDLLVGATHINPDCYRSAQARLSTEFERLCALILCVRHHKKLRDEQLLIFTAGMPQSPLEFQVTTTIDIIDYHVRQEDEIEVERELNGSLTALSSLKDLYSSLDPYFIWQQANSAEDLALAIKTYLFLQRNVSPDSCMKCAIGSSLVHAIKSKHLGGRVIAEQILRSIAEVILDSNLRHSHELGKMRGTHVGWRRDVNRDSHLHYWMTPAGPELAWVTVTHDDYYIPE